MRAITLYIVPPTRWETQTQQPLAGDGLMTSKRSDLEYTRIGRVCEGVPWPAWAYTRYNERGRRGGGGVDTEHWRWGL